MIYLLYFPASVVIGALVGIGLVILFDVSNFEGGAGYLALYLIMPVAVIIQYSVFYLLLRKANDKTLRITKKSLLIVNIALLFAFIIFMAPSNEHSFS